MSRSVIADSYTIEKLRRKARAARLQAWRASPTLAMQLKSLAELYEAEAERMASLASALRPAPSL
jgi:propanediol dehydratase small subunit